MHLSEKIAKPSVSYRPTTGGHQGRSPRGVLRAVCTTSVRVGLELSCGRLSPALPGSALLFGLAFGCGWASSWMNSLSHPRSDCSEVTMAATKMTKVRRLTYKTVSTFLATVAEMAVGLATSG